MRRVGLDQLAQARDLHVDGAIEYFVFAPAREFHQFVTRQRHARVSEQDFQQREFSRGERDRGAGAGQRAGGEIDRDLAEAHLAFLDRGGARRQRGGTPAQHGMDARHQFARVERFGQVIVGTHFQADDAVDVVALGGQHDDRDRVLRPAQAPAHRQTVFARHHQVEHDQVEALAREQFVHGGGVLGDVNAEALLGQVAVEQVAQPQVVIDHEDSGFCGCHVRIVLNIAGRQGSMGKKPCQISCCLQIITNSKPGFTLSLHHGASMRPRVNFTDVVPVRSRAAKIGTCMRLTGRAGATTIGIMAESARRWMVPARSRSKA